MNFGFTEEQELLRDQVRRFLDDKCPLAEVRKICDSNQGYSKSLWAEMADLGWLGLIVPTEYSGVGLGWVDLIVILEEAGRTLYPSPFISTVLVASTIADLGSEQQKKEILPDISRGNLIASLAILDAEGAPSPDSIAMTGERSATGVTLSGVKTFVMDATLADLFLIGFRLDGDLMLAIVRVQADAVEISGSATVDRTKQTGTLRLDQVQVTESNLLRVSDQEMTRLFDKGAVAVCAEMVGAAESALTITSNYAKERTQFGSPIGRYQGIKHPLAEMYVDVESFKSLLYYAAWTIDESPSELSRSASLAKAYASNAFVNLGINGVQLHGAIGYTAEYDIQLFFKRSKWARPVFGDSDYHYERVARLGGM